MIPTSQSPDDFTGEIVFLRPSIHKPYALVNTQSLGLYSPAERLSETP
jgi:hypothetical protein